MNAHQHRQDRRRVTRRAEGIHPDAFPAKCPITGRPYFMTLDHPELGMVPTYGGPYDSFTIPHAEGEASQPWHERELVQYRYDHDAGGWLLDVVETIPLRIIHDDVRDRLEDAEDTLKALGYVYEGHRWKAPHGVDLPDAVQRLAEDLYSNREWREDQDIAAGRHLTVKEMYEAAEREAAYKLEQLAKDGE